MRQQIIAINQFIHVCFFFWVPGGTWADESFSAKCWRTRDINPRLWRWVDRLFFWEPHHCQQAYINESIRRDMPPEVRNA